MNPDVFEVINRSKFTEINASYKTEDLLSWVEQVLHSYSDSIRCPKYQSVFLCKDIENNENTLGAVGRLLGIKVSVSNTGILGELDYLGKVFFSTVINTETKYSTIPFYEVFTLCKSLYDKARECISPKFYHVPFIGGVKSIILQEQNQEIVNYYLPEIELIGRNGLFNLFTANHIPEEIFLPKPVACDEVLPRARFLGISEEPSKVEYISSITKVIKRLNDHYLDKIVISKKRSIQPDQSFKKEQYIKHLLRKYYQEYFYFFRQGEDDYWAGISPEVIIKQHGRQAVTEPLAGTRKKTSDISDYEAVRNNLTSTPKDISEHDFASIFMHDQLVRADIGQVRVSNNKTLLETPYAYHLKSKITIDLKTTTSFFDIIRAIYPPPTIWGIPVEKIEKILLESENFDREYYTGLYGYWTFADTANIALVIRSVKIGEESICLYAGGGIVASSNPDAEYEEAENKMLPLMDYFVN